MNLDWFKKWWASEPDIADDHNGGPLEEQFPGDWVVMPYRVAEACRISLATVGAHPDLPEDIRQWIIQWLTAYNASLSLYFQQNYGPDVFPVLERITLGVRALSEQYYAEKHNEAMHESFQRWEREIYGDEQPPPPSAPTG